MIERTKIVIALLLAVLLAFSLTGVSYYFPKVNEKTFNIMDILDEEAPVQQGNYTVGMITNLPNITINKDGIIEPQDAQLQKIGDTYILTEDIINKTLWVERNNTVIDGENHKIQGTLNAAEGIVLQGINNVTIKNVEITKFWFGTSLTNCSNITIDENVLSNIGSRAIKIVSSNSTVISDNVISYTATAIEITSPNGCSTNSTIARNTITNAAQGITIDGSLSTITENILANIHLPIGSNGNNTIISKNNLVNGIGGIYLTGNYGTIYQNQIANFSQSGITINHGTNCNIYENSISNSQCGIILRNHEDTWIIENNSFYHNNFINYTQSISVELPSHSNFWNNGYEGNYWSNYNGTDSDGDGIGDTPYVIDENNIDYFPLMSQHHIEDERNMLFVYLGIIGLVSFGFIVSAIMMANRRKSKENMQTYS